ncbi:hypothetical protein [Lutibacter sp.]|uniref:hypothetical protein n=1 Tax=Lutibacter sp. TaxID=1925666 RepID=UPI0034A0A93A
MKFKELFKKKKKEDLPEELKEEFKEEVSYPEGTIKCEACEEPLFPWEKRKTHAGKKFHIKCYRKALKIAKTQIKNGIGNL